MLNINLPLMKRSIYQPAIGCSCGLHTWPTLLQSLCNVSYLYVGCNGSITSVGEERICLLSFSCTYVVSVRRGFLFLWVLEMGCVILL